MEPLGWPFLVSCNKKLDYRAVVAPDFVIRAGATRNLADAVGDDSEDPGALVHRSVSLPGTGTVLLIFRALPATAGLIGDRGEERLRDDWGRPIYLIEGLALTPPYPRHNLTEAEILQLHGFLAKEFRVFWNSDKWQPKASSLLSRAADGTLSNQLFQEAPILPATSTDPPPPETPTLQAPLTTPDDLPFPKKTVWSPERLTSLQHPSGEEIVSLSFSPKGDYLVGRTLGQEIAVWRSTDRRLIRRRRLGPLNTSSHCPVAFESGESTYVITVIKTERSWLLVRYDLEMDEVATFCEVRYEPLLIACPPRERQIYGSSNLEATVWEFRQPFFGKSFYVQALDFEGFTAFASSRDGTTQVTGDRSGTIRHYEDTLKGAPRRVWLSSARITHLALSANARNLISADGKNRVSQWSWQSPKNQLLYSHPSQIIGLSTGPTEDIFISGDEAGLLVFWDLPTSSRVDTSLDEGNILGFTLSPSRRYLAVALEGGRIQILDLRNLPMQR